MLGLPPIEGGRFEAVAGQLITEAFTLSWVDRFKPAEASPEGTEGAEGGAVKVDKSNRLKYHCPGCRAQVWGKPGLKVRCGDCLTEPLFEVWR